MQTANSSGTPSKQGQEGGGGPGRAGTNAKRRDYSAIRCCSELAWKMEETKRRWRGTFFQEPPFYYPTLHALYSNPNLNYDTRTPLYENNQLSHCAKLTNTKAHLLIASLGPLGHQSLSLSVSQYRK